MSSSHGEVLTGSRCFKNLVVPSSVRSQVHCQASVHLSRLNLCLSSKKCNLRQSGEPDPLNSGRKEACNQVIAQKCSMCFYSKPSVDLVGFTCLDVSALGENSPFVADVSDVATTGTNLAGRVTSCRTVSECQMPCISLRQENK